MKKIKTILDLDKNEITVLCVYLKKALDRGIKLEDNPELECLEDGWIVNLTRELEQYSNKKYLERLLK